MQFSVKRGAQITRMVRFMVKVMVKVMVMVRKMLSSQGGGLSTWAPRSDVAITLVLVFLCTAVTALLFSL